MYEVFSSSHCYDAVCALVGHLAKQSKGKTIKAQLIDHPSHAHVLVPAFGASVAFKWRGAAASALRTQVDSVVGLEARATMMEKVTVQGIDNSAAGSFVEEAEAHWDAIGKKGNMIRVYAATYNDYDESWTYEHLLPRRMLKTVYHPEALKEGLKTSLATFQRS
jgi:hypothetical protein